GKHFLFYQLEISPAILCEKFAALYGSFSLFKTQEVLGGDSQRKGL
ncbi:MAG: hypothetical protein XD84_1956, partial [Desulfotomaculum sp. 46_80]